MAEDLATGAKDSPVSVAITVTAGLGWVDMSQFTDATRDYFTQLDNEVEGFERRGGPVSHRLFTVGIRSQVRLPRLVFLETGFDVLDHRKSVAISIGGAQGEIRYRNFALLIPVIAGAHVPIGNRLAVSGGVGPLVLLAANSRWTYSLGQISSFKGDIGAGFEVASGIELDIGWRLRLTADLRYRFAKSGELTTDGPELPPLQPVEEQSWSGVSLETGLRLVLD